MVFKVDSGGLIKKVVENIGSLFLCLKAEKFNIEFSTTKWDKLTKLSQNTNNQSRLKNN
ncbi:hypothetical protein J2T12_003049 [Paenibacillus anaericanus]|nr:hypothetical protein [Paenibacillus anaericanus]